MKIKKVLKGSLGYGAGLRQGYELLEINGSRIEDNIDLRFYESDDLLDIRFRNKSGIVVKTSLEKEIDDTLGIELEQPHYRSCGNKCIFCFVDQMPRGFRKALYFKDEDFRLSFLHGNYITLSNISPRDLARIKKQRLSPLYISVHATNKTLRKEMLGSKRELDIIGLMKDIIASGIELHTQIVLCPGINDGPVLKETIYDLIGLYPGVKSIAVVPVGLTKHRVHLYPLKQINKEYSRQLIASYKELQAKLRKRFKKTILYFADEFYLNAGLDFPGSFWYDEYPQIDNGVGMGRYLWSSFKKMEKELPKRSRVKKNYILITGISGIRVIKPIVDRLSRIKGIHCQVVPVKNELFGDSVTVSGLLAGKDILSTLEGIRGGRENIVLPENLLNDQGMFIDDLTLAEFKAKLRPNKVIIGMDKFLRDIQGVKAIR
jgi:putative radical SAM enzyme (TIGR03279 family)